MLIFKSTPFVAFILLLFSGFNVTSAETDSIEGIPEDYSEYEQELQYLEKLQEREEEQEVLSQQLVSDSVSEKSAATLKDENPEIEPTPEQKPNAEVPETKSTNPGAPRRIRSR